jgi:hypothetical protein
VVDFHESCARSFRGDGRANEGEPMTTRSPRFLGWSFLALASAAAAAALPGCSSDSGPAPEGAPAVVEPADLPGKQLLGEYVLHVDPVLHLTTLRRLVPGATQKLLQMGPGYRPESVDSLTVNSDGVAGSGPTNTVELVTELNAATMNYVDYNASCAGYTGSGIFCADVTTRSFYTRSLNNAYVQVTAITNASTGADVSSNHSAIGGDASPSSPNTAISATMGLWRYPSAAASFLSTVSPSNAATRHWTFNNPDDLATNIYLRVVASLTYKDYTQSAGSVAYVDACLLAGASSTGSATGAVSVTMPFTFTLYNVSSTTANYGRDGVFTLGSTTLPNSNNGSSTYTFQNTFLPENPNSLTTSPAGYVFWDGLNYSTNASPLGAGKLCSATQGSAPNRQFIITWKNMRGFLDTTDTTNLFFDAILNEGTDTLDFAYGTMQGTAATDPNIFPSSPTVTYAQRAQGKKAVIGLQGVGTSGSNISTLQPALRGGTATSTGTKLRFTPAF